MSITLFLAHGDPMGYLWAFFGLPLFIVAFIAALFAVVWLLCRVFGQAPPKRRHDDRTAHRSESESASRHESL